MTGKFRHHQAFNGLIRNKISPCQHTCAAQDPGSDSKNSRQKAQRRRLLKKHPLNLPRRCPNTGKDPQLPDLAFHQHSKGMTDNKNQRKTGRRQHAPKQYQNTPGLNRIRITGIHRKIQIQKAGMIDHVPFPKSCKPGNPRKILIC